VWTRRDGESGDGESGDLGETVVDFDVTNRNEGPFEGDLESERRNCARADDGWSA
jgi:hypothetical protein